MSPFSVKPISSLIRFQRVKSTATQRIGESPTRSWASAPSNTLRSRSAIAPTDEEAAVPRAISLKFEFLFHYRDDSSWWGAVASRQTLLSCWSPTIRHNCAASDKTLLPKTIDAKTRCQMLRHGLYSAMTSLSVRRHVASMAAISQSAPLVSFR